MSFNFKFVQKYIVLHLCCTVFCQSSLDSVDENSYTVCQKFTGTFDPYRQVSDQSINQGRPGKRGPKGDKGSLGNINESEIVKGMARELDLIKSCDGLLRKGICYFLLEVSTNYQTALNECQKHGGKLAAIHSRQLYGALFKFVYDGLVYWQSNSYVQFWIAGTYSNIDGEVTLDDTSISPFVLWYNGYPRATEGDIYMAFEVKKSLSGNQNMFNIHGRHNAYPLCQR